MRSDASIVCAASETTWPMAVMCPPSMAMSPTKRGAPVPSTIVPLRITRSCIRYLPFSLARSACARRSSFGIVITTHETSCPVQNMRGPREVVVAPVAVVVVNTQGNALWQDVEDLGERNVAVPRHHVGRHRSQCNRVTELRVGQQLRVDFPKHLGLLAGAIKLCWV